MKVWQHKHSKVVYKTPPAKKFAKEYIEVVVIPWEKWAAIQAALAGAEETLLEIMADDVFAEMIKGAPLPRKTSKRKISEDCSNALARLRAVKDNGKPSGE